MRGTKMFNQVREAISNLNPHDVREIADRQFAIELYAKDNPGYWQMERYFVPAEASNARRAEIRQVIFRAGEAHAPVIIKIYEEGVTPAAEGFVFDPDQPERTVEEILEKHEDLRIALARRVCPFRPPVVKQIIREVSKENAMFSVATAVPAILPFISLPWAIGEFASDTAFITANQMRMAFQLAAASDREIGYKKQRSEIASLVAGAFGWRALARELVGKIPLGGRANPEGGYRICGHVRRRPFARAVLPAWLPLHSEGTQAGLRGRIRTRQADRRIFPRAVSRQAARLVTPHRAREPRA